MKRMRLELLILSFIFTLNSWMTKTFVLENFCYEHNRVSWYKNTKWNKKIIENYLKKYFHKKVSSLEVVKMFKYK